ncbi:MAG: hypothetical protein JW810_10270 [Sedimentisphaerales bacterium]|nr:hypothetical protein [Sedimentisphaerales bacterium]
MKKTSCLIAFVIMLPFATWSLAAAAPKPLVYVTFWFDTEDFILPEADDAAKRLAEMFSERRVKATFKIVGEKARVLEERGRDDVIGALAANDVAYHSTYHSIHPTPAEYTRDLDWHEGVSEFIRREGAGLETLRRVFGVNASCYGQPGGSWTPQSYAACRAWGVPLYLDATSHVNVNDRPFWYGGVLTILGLGDAVQRTGWTDDDLKEACAKFDRVHERLMREGGGIVSIYYHPCEFVHRQFWDAVNFAGGANPPRSQWKLPPLKSVAEQEQAFGAFESYLDHIVNHPDVRLVTARQIPSLYPDRVYSRPLMRSDVLAVARAFQERLSYVALDGRIVSAAEGLLALAHAVARLDGDSQPEEIALEFAYGPACLPRRFVTEGTFSGEAVRQAAGELLETVQATEQLPSIVWVAGQPLRPEDFAVTLASLVAEEHPLGTVPMRQGELAAKRYVADNAPGLWGWVIFPEGFDAPRMMELAKLQAWTIKPAALRGSN